MEPTLPYGGALEYHDQDPRFLLNISHPEAGARGQYLAVACPEVEWFPIFWRSAIGEFIIFSLSPPDGTTQMAIGEKREGEE